MRYATVSSSDISVQQGVNTASGVSSKGDGRMPSNTKLQFCLSLVNIRCSDFPVDRDIVNDS